ncbi:Tad domain-containing protein [Vibrio neptunius]|uniref:Tad domain-containing protein n=1 Tax=Vibrio neptunius TaxID=170651 RepID=A0ABS2ZY42_9VIBR|nr:Tad domain-containing protein [Vibrio neptunius]MBN3515059.1 Tad domain-containing protein [Vibrio neptunius]MBN3548681.1 Tad domain-containing protein [Vibrio neptunius]MBN3577187.1 Tad domain-containing protein [Vibrio neptunius]MCH9870852.1 Tad domain-containing protein [Vibrio neptunius]
MLKPQTGSVSLAFLALLIPLVVLSAATIMIGFQVQLSSRAMQAVDAASLACAFSDYSDPGVNQAYLDYYQPNIKLVTSEIFSTSGCEINMGYSLTGLFSSLKFAQASYSAQSNSVAQANVNQSSSVTPTEMTLVLDISSSMTGSIETLKRILIRAIERIERDNVQIDGRRAISISIVPFSDGVSARNTAWLEEKGVFCIDGLTKQAGGSVLVNETVRNLDRIHSEKAVSHRKPGEFLADCSASATLVSLTDDMNEVKTAINALTTTGGTRSYQGVIWGARQLIPRWRQEWGYNPYSLTPKQKLILMTDGVDSGYVLDDLIEAGLCDRLANEFAIELNFIGFNVQESRLAQFQSCINAANTEGIKGQVFSATNTEKLDEYFSKILEVQYDTTLNFGQK